VDWAEEFMQFSGKKFWKRLDQKVWHNSYNYIVVIKWKFQCKRLRNPEQNGWEVSNTGAIISSNRLLANDYTKNFLNVFAKKGFPINAELSRTDKFPGTILYYYEVTYTAPSYQWVKVFQEKQNY
jgi:hypothetical protein